MKLFKYAKYIGAFTGAVALLMACDKIDEPTPLGDGGVTIVKLIGGGTFEEPGTPLKGIDFAAKPQSSILIDIRRDVVTNAELNTSQTVTVKVDTAMMRIYNDSLASWGEATYKTMPAAWYTSTPSFTWGGTFDITFAPGEFGKQVRINVPDASLFDPSAVYGFPFTIVSANPAKQITTDKSIISLLGAKNKYDGVYSMNSYHNRPGFQLLVEDEDMQLITTGANDVDFYWPRAGSNGHPIMTTTGISWYGAAISPRMSFDPNTNLVTSVINGVAGGTVIDMMSPTAYPISGVSRYDEANKRIYVYWRYSLNNERGFFDTLNYVGPR